MEYLMVGLISWVACGVFTYGLVLAWLQKSFPTVAERDRTKDRLAALFFAIFGPIGFTVFFVLGRRGPEHGFMWRVPKDR